MSNLVARLLAAQAEGLRPNAERFLSFIGPGPLELQILGGPKYSETQYAHPVDTADAVRLFEAAERITPTGVYVVFNEPDEAVTTRAEQGRWHNQIKGEALTDADITHRRALFVDIDWARVRGTSTTDEMCAASLEAAARVHARLAGSVPAAALGLGHSGNCGSVFVALDRLPECPALSDLVKEALACLHLLFTDPRIQADKKVRDGIEVDESVCDAKRLAPAYGTTKRKGAAKIEKRPHRRTAFICEPETRRLSLEEFQGLVASLRGELTTEQRGRLDKLLKRPGAAKATPAPVAASVSPKAAATPLADADAETKALFRRANECPIAEVLQWLDLVGSDDSPICPGCRSTGDTSVALVENGLKCLHSRCSTEGLRGFRTVVDVVTADRKCTPIEAVRLLAEQFSFEVPAAKAKGATGAKRTTAPPPTSFSTAVPGEDWQGLLTIDKWGNPKPSYGNLCIALRAVFSQRLAFDEMRGAPTMDGRSLGDADVGRIRERLEREFHLPQSEANIISGVRQIAEERSFHPVREYLRSLQWDGTVRLPSVSGRYLGASDTLSARMVQAWFVSAVRRALEPGCKVDTAFVLVGDQGIRKSSFFNTLGGDWFSDSTMDISSRDGLMQLASAWIYEWGELEHVTSRKQAAEVKGFITSRHDTFRLPFGRAIVKHPRSSVVVGSTNEPEFLNDPTGDRRFWIVDVPKGHRIDIAALATDRDQLWAEAVTNGDSNYQIWLTEEEEARRSAAAEVHHVCDPIQELIEEWLCSAEAVGIERRNGGWITMPDLLTNGLRIEPARWVGDKVLPQRVGHAMKRLKWLHRRRRVPSSDTVAKTERTVYAYLRPGSALAIEEALMTFEATGAPESARIAS